MISEIELDKISYEYAKNNIDNKKYSYLKTKQVNDFNIENYVNINICASNKHYRIDINVKKNIKYDRLVRANIISVVNDKLAYNKKITKKNLLEMQLKNYYYFYINNIKQKEINIVIELRSNNTQYLDIELKKKIILYY